MNQLFYGDNLQVLRDYIADESVDLIYLDPPFNSNANYNVLFAEHDGTRAAAQIETFEDTWRWDEVAARAYQETVETDDESIRNTGSDRRTCRSAWQDDRRTNPDRQTARPQGYSRPRATRSYRSPS
jgi:hypothetical protein